MVGPLEDAADLNKNLESQNFSLCPSAIERAKVLFDEIDKAYHNWSSRVLVAPSSATLPHTANIINNKNIARAGCSSPKDTK